jgi:hypothetical protein
VLTKGEHVTLQIDNAQVISHTVDCEVMSVSAEFLGCAADRSNGASAFDRSAHESWYNLRFVIRIDRPVKE